jgi:hypothetical protein
MSLNMYCISGFPIDHIIEFCDVLIIFEGVLLVP